MLPLKCCYSKKFEMVQIISLITSSFLYSKAHGENDSRLGRGKPQPMSQIQASHLFLYGLRNNKNSFYVF